MIRWNKEKRFDIIRELYPVEYYCEECNLAWHIRNGPKCLHCGKKGEVTSRWIDHRFRLDTFSQSFGNPRCPFLKKVRNESKYVCKINDTKPIICKEFPNLSLTQVTKNEEECIKYDCEGYKEWVKNRSRD